MLELAHASAIGFGTRAWSGAGEDERTLVAALERGCTLVALADVDPGQPPAAVERTEHAVGRVLSRRLDDVAVVATTADLRTAAVVERVRVCAARLRQDRLDVLVLDPVGWGHAAVQQAFATCERLSDRGELACYGVRVESAAHVSWWLRLAAEVRTVHRFLAVQLADAVTDAQRHDALAVAHRSGLQVLGAAGLEDCRRRLDAGVDHVVVAPRDDAQVDAVRAWRGSYAA